MSKQSQVQANAGEGVPMLRLSLTTSPDGEVIDILVMSRSEFVEALRSPQAAWALLNDLHVPQDWR